jgi:Rps23 Pro-64 3,4-dihydroxylase Tpa1-like proline 4-hydroxylase
MPQSSIQELCSGIYLVDNFFSEYHLLYDDIIQNESLYFTNTGCCIKRYRSLCDRQNNESLINAVSVYGRLLKEVVSETFSISAVSQNLSTFDAHVYEEGCFIQGHKDDYDSNFPKSPNLVSTIHYLNDDYSGGEIEFFGRKSPIKPAANQLLIFYSDIEHGTKAVLSGTKISSTRFWKDSKNEQ